MSTRANSARGRETGEITRLLKKLDEDDSEVAEELLFKESEHILRTSALRGFTASWRRRGRRAIHNLANGSVASPGSRELPAARLERVNLAMC